MGSKTGKTDKSTTTTAAVAKDGSNAPSLQSINEARATVEVKIADQVLVGTKRQFKSGKHGYFVNGKIVIDGIKCQVSGSIVMVRSDQSI